VLRQNVGRHYVVRRFVEAAMDDADFDLGLKDPAPEALTADFRAGLDELGLSQRRLAAKMMALGDSRAFDTILRGVQRMATGEARVSGEMQVIVTLLMRERTRAKRMAARTRWARTDDCLTATVDGVRLSLSPQTRGRWQIHAAIDAPKGYSPAIPHWRNSLEEAKLRAMLCVDEALDQADPKG
jgi:hypothetical protein